MKPMLVKLTGTRRFQRILEGIPVTMGMKSGYITLNPGESVGEHKTEAKEEAVIILEGEAQVYSEGKVLFTVGARSFIYIPSETNHNIKNSGDKLLHYVYVVAPIKEKNLTLP